ncbi:aminotransferase class I/II-fold pyridoxal phosphate-dependent enzyme [Ekhidna sp.]|uniref:aminotransferase class I/II-fold pyridoxal phosphate-dependent enzyme n=1 Tax=Ekhidna sp. TaxID=2608089 RepID=UPI0035132FE9
MNSKRIYLSPPNVDELEKNEVAKVLDSGWVAPVGDAIEEFERELEVHYPEKHVLALNSGTSALHLALVLAGVEDGDQVVVSSFTFAACANVILYERAVPVFLDSERKTWNLDPDLLERYLSATDKLPKAIIVTHLYGMPAQIERIVSVASEYKIAVIEDAAEAVGSNINGKHVGGFGAYGILSFNGNKIITTSAGGALICHKEGKVRGLHLATQANLGSFGYEHKEAGYNYRMSNVLAGIGIGQLGKLQDFVRKKRLIFEKYKNAFSNDFDFLEEPENYFSNRWLSAGILKVGEVESLIAFLDKKNIETRRLWKPLHLHETYRSAMFHGSGVAANLYKKGVCLPSGTGITDDQQSYVIDQILDWLNKQRAS